MSAEDELGLMDDATPSSAAMEGDGQRYRFAAHATSDAIWDWNLGDDTVQWSEKFGTLFGHDLARVASTGDWRRNQIHPDDRARVVHSIHQSLEAGQQHWSAQYRFHSADGMYVPVLDRAFIQRDAQGRAQHMIGVMLDISAVNRAMEAQRISDERYRFVAMATNDAQWDWDLATDRLDWNECFAEMFGYDDRNVPRTVQRWAELVHPDDRQRVMATRNAAIKGAGENWSEEYRLRRADGFYASVYDRGFVVRDSEGRAVRMVGAMLDVTERKRVEEALRESEQRFRTLTQAVPQIVWTADPQGNVDFFNERWNEFTGMPCADGFGWNWQPAVHPNDRDRTLQQWHQSLRMGEHFEIEHRLRRHDGAYRWYLTRALPLRDDEGNITRWFGTCTDIHEQKVAETALVQSQVALKRLNDTLEQRVAERTWEAEQRAAQLRELASALTSAEQRERRRLAELLHDHLQQLLVGAKMKLGMLRRSMGSPEDQELADQVKVLLSQSIATSRTLTVELSPPVLYDAGLATALNWLAHWMEEKHGLKVRVEADESPEPFNDDVRVFFFQAVREMLFNVVKHAQTDQAYVRLVMNEKECVHLSVEDEGVGADERALSRMQLRDGAGFGLFNIRERLELLGGELRTSAAPGKGMCLTMCVPHAQLVRMPRSENGRVSDPTADAAATERRLSPAGVIRVLLVDDHAIVREGLAGLLDPHSDIAVIGEAHDGHMAVQMADELKPDVIIMDVSMPRLNGIEATRRIMAAHPHMRIIGLSMHERESMARAMRNAGAAVYLPKGGPSEVLLDAVRGIDIAANVEAQDH